jgi:hypothetical protein
MIPFLSSCSRSRQRSSALIGFFPDTSTGVAHRTKNQLFLFFRCCVAVLPCSKIQATGYGAELFTISHILKRHQKENFIGRKKRAKIYSFSLCYRSNLRTACHLVVKILSRTSFATRSALCCKTWAHSKFTPSDTLSTTGISLK